MDATTSTETRFARVIRQKLVENKIAGRKPDSIRGLARTMANGDAGLSETHKRSLFKWMALEGPRPTAISKGLVAHALGNCTVDELPGEDDEESDPVATIGRALELMFERALLLHMAKQAPAIREALDLA